MSLRQLEARALFVASCVAVAVAGACSQAKEDSSADDSADAGGAGEANAGGPGGSVDVFEDTTCDRSDCEGFTVGGVEYAACCIPRAGACGVAVGNTCVDRAAFSPRSDAGMIGIGFDFGAPEPVFLDPSCPGLTSVMGMPSDLPGCCDSTGVCGYSTAGIGMAQGFDIPEMCVGPDDPLGSILTSGSVPAPCDYPGDAGAGDGG